MKPPRSLSHPIGRIRRWTATIALSIETLLRTVRGPRPPGPQGGDDSLMRAYELMVIVDRRRSTTPSSKSAVRRIGEQIEAKQGEIKTTDRWGKRRFAYEIDHKHEGYYIVLEIVAEACASTISSASCGSRTTSSATS